MLPRRPRRISRQNETNWNLPKARVLTSDMLSFTHVFMLTPLNLETRWSQRTFCDILQWRDDGVSLNSLRDEAMSGSWCCPSIRQVLLWPASFNIKGPVELPGGGWYRKGFVTFDVKNLAASFFFLSSGRLRSPSFSLNHCMKAVTNASENFMLLFVGVVETKTKDWCWYNKRLVLIRRVVDETTLWQPLA